MLVTGRKLRDLNIETGGREIEELEQIDTLARDPSVPEAALPAPNVESEAAE